mmetsp:Transcript_29591/g.100586  ORF Transcript_29591/g.100586 Transcript_29591/m.100586 type:complete len:223 (+) Transcript_29591:95-763(+)
MASYMSCWSTLGMTLKAASLTSAAVASGFASDPRKAGAAQTSNSSETTSATLASAPLHAPAETRSWSPGFTCFTKAVPLPWTWTAPPSAVAAAFASFPAPTAAMSCARSTGTQSKPRASDATMSAGPPLKRMDLAAQRKPMLRSKVLSTIMGSMNWLLCGAIATRSGQSLALSLCAPATATWRKKMSTQPLRKLQMSMRVDTLYKIQMRHTKDPTAVDSSGG